MTSFKNNLTLVKSLVANKQLLTASPSINWFMTKYLGKFQLLDVDGNLILHSHLPAINSKAFTRFIDEHLLGMTEGPSHAQIAITNACPQHCSYCYNKDRSGKVLSTAQIKQQIQKLKRMGVFWLGFTGGEPLLNKDIVEIVASAGDDFTLKLFTTGVGLSEALAQDLKHAGLRYVSISLDHAEEVIHDQIRGYEGAYQAVMQAIAIFKRIGVHVSVSSVMTRDMLEDQQIEAFLEFLIGLGVHEAWLSEAKPTSEPFWHAKFVITEAERLRLLQLQDRYNKKRRITVNFLGHFEGGEHFGCYAGNKMLYIDAFGEVSPCVFVPMTFGNIHDNSVETIFAEMKQHFPSESNCFINHNYELLKKYYHGEVPLKKIDSVALMQEVQFSPLSSFTRLHQKQMKKRVPG